MLKLAGEFIEGQLADHMVDLKAHMDDACRMHRTGRMYIGGGANPETLAANTLYGGSLFLARAMTFDRICVDVTVAAAAGKKARVGIYNDGTNLYPGSLILDAGEVAVDSTGLKAININQKLAAGLYWVACVSDGTPTVNSATWNPNKWILGGTEATGYLSARAWSKAFTYAALPNPFTAGGSLDASNWRCYGVLRVASLD